jgi:ATP-dependent Clp protease protease subunit
MTQQDSQQEVTLLDNISLTNLGAYMLFEDINEDSALELCEYLLKANIICNPTDVLTLFINSGGGSVTDGWAIIDIMESSRIDISTVAIGCIASMAVLIFVAGAKGKRIMTPKTAVMTHQFSTAFWGKQHELIAARKFHDTLEKQFIDHFVRHTKMTAKQVRDVLLKPSDTWLTPEECLAYGICDAVRDPWGDEEKAAKPKAKKAAKSKAKKPASQ